MFEPPLHRKARVPCKAVCSRLLTARASHATINAPIASAKGTAPQTHTRHITSRWYSSPDCAPAAILAPWIATHTTGLGA